MASGQSLFEQKLIEAMHDGVMFVDEQNRIQLWSKGAERLTGVSAGAAHGRNFTPDLLDMCSSEAELVDEVRITVVHEIAHHFGISDDRLHELGYA